MKAALTFLLLLLGSSHLWAQASKGLEYKTETNILYREGPELDSYQRERCRLDVYYPSDKTDFSTVVWFHGGGLKAGNRKIPNELKEKGIAVVPVNYRLYPKVKEPVYIEDAAAAVAWTLKNIEKYGGSRQKVFVSGHSAGGYLTSMIGLDKRWLEKHEIDADELAGLIPYSGHTITHFTVRAERNIDGKQPIIDHMAPLFHIRNDCPPLLLITGDRDLEMLGRYEENAYLWRMMKVVGHPNTELFELDGYNHGQMAGPAHPLLLRFVKKIEAAIDKSAESTTVTKISPPPVDLDVPRYFKKHVSASGYPIISTERVNDYALREAAFLINKMLAKRPDIRKAMVANGSKLVVMAHDEFTTDNPYHADLKPKEYWDKRARGLGGDTDDPICSCAEENLLGYKGDPYSSENILIHEFAHNIHLVGLAAVDPTFDVRLKAAYESAMEQGLWKTKYASVNKEEYWAEGVQSWFSNNREPDHDHNHVNTREELLEYDSRLASLCKEVFGDTKLVYTKPHTRLREHMAGYQPENAPRFAWPARLKKADPLIRNEIEQRTNQ